jgi:hypothetical protein
MNVEKATQDLLQAMRDHAALLDKGKTKELTQEVSTQIAKEGARLNAAYDGFKENELIIYNNGYRHEIGKIKSLTSTGAFVWYGIGDTASLTNFEDMHKLTNDHYVDLTTLGNPQLSLRDLGALIVYSYKNNDELAILELGRRMYNEGILCPIDPALLRTAKEWL